MQSPVSQLLSSRCRFRWQSPSPREFRLSAASTPLLQVVSLSPLSPGAAFRLEDLLALSSASSPAWLKGMATQTGSVKTLRIHIHFEPHIAARLGRLDKPFAQVGRQIGSARRLH